MTAILCVLAVAAWMIGWWLVIDISYGLYQDAKIAIPKFWRNWKKSWKQRR